MNRYNASNAVRKRSTDATIQTHTTECILYRTIYYYYYIYVRFDERGERNGFLLYTYNAEGQVLLLLGNHRSNGSFGRGSAKGIGKFGPSLDYIYIIFRNEHSIYSHLATPCDLRNILHILVQQWQAFLQSDTTSRMTERMSWSGSVFESDDSFWECRFSA